ncbi:hypothetical protein OSTOST_02805 [Ostertagia ostertagi]
MPLIKRAVSPVNVSRVKIPPEVTNGELQYVANSTLANLIRQLSSISKHAEHIFGEIYLEAMKLDHKSNTLEKRITNLTEKVSKLDSTNEQEQCLCLSASLGEAALRKAVQEVPCWWTQHTLDRTPALPVALAEVYSRCDPPPNLDALNPFQHFWLERDPGAPSALSLYTNPSFFFDLWRQEMLKDCADNTARRRIKSPPPDGLNMARSPKKRRQRLPPQQQEVPRQQAARYMSSLRNARSTALSFPDEYQAPQALGLQLHKTSQIQHFQPVQTSTPSQTGGMSIRAAPAPENRQRANLSPPKELKRELPPPDLALLSIDDEDEELPPPPPTLMHTSVVNHLPSPPPSAMQLVPSDAQAVVPPPPPPPPPPQNLITPSAPSAATFGGVTKTSTETEEEEKKPDTRSNLLAEIQSGIKLKKHLD